MTRPLSPEEFDRYVIELDREMPHPRVLAAAYSAGALPGYVGTVLGRSGLSHADALELLRRVQALRDRPRAR